MSHRSRMGSGRSSRTSGKVGAALALFATTALLLGGEAVPALGEPVDSQEAPAFPEETSSPVLDLEESPSAEVSEVPAVPESGAGLPDDSIPLPPAGTEADGAATDLAGEWEIGPGDIAAMLRDVESAFASVPNGGGTASPLAYSGDTIEPKVLFFEDFENQNASQTPISLNNYVGGEAAQNMAYGASNYWLDAGYCNGFVTSFNTNLTQNQIINQYCGANRGFGPGDYWAVRAKAWALGHLTEGDPKANQALSTNTSGGTPDASMFRTESSIDLQLDDADSEGRFIAFSVDAANTYCTSSERDPRMRFSLVQDGQETALKSSEGTDYIDPCTSRGSTSFDAANEFNVPASYVAPYGWSYNRDTGQGQSWAEHRDWIAKGRYGRFYSDSIVLDSNSSLGLKLENYSTASSGGAGIGNPQYYGWGSNNDQYHSGPVDGNDGAIDNIRIVDVTPKMVKEFDPVVQSVGRPSEMTISVVNRSDLGKKQGWEFTDTLPEGLEFVNADVTHTCGAGTTVEVDVENGQLHVGNGVLNNGQAHCDIVTTVTSLDAEKFVNGKPNGNFSNLKRIDGPDDAEVEFKEGSLTWNKVDAHSEPLAGSVWEIEGPTPDTMKEPQGGWIPQAGRIEDCVAESAAECTGADIDPEAGKFKVAGLPTGEYVLKEVEAPEGYIIPEGQKEYTVEITLDALEGRFGPETGIVNELGSLKWNKVDEEGSALAGSEWKLTGEGLDEEREIVDCVGESESACADGIDKNPAEGQFLLNDLPTGDYVLEETKAPTGYALPDPARWEFTIAAGEQQHIELGDIENKKLPDAVITVAKKVSDVAGNNAEPASGWEMAVELAQGSVEGVKIDPMSTQETGEDGKTGEWRISFPTADTTTSVTVSEKLEQHVGYELQKAKCTITSLGGDPRTTPFDETSFEMKDVKPGDLAYCEFTNKPKAGTVVWEKVAAGVILANHLEGSEWELTGPLAESPVTITDCTSGDCADSVDKDPGAGKFKLSNLPWGEYTLVETKAPAGYVIGDDNKYTFTIGPASGQPLTFEYDLGKIENDLRDGPNLPLTGGIGRDFFAILGLATLVVGGAAAGFAQIRKRRRNL